MRLGMPGDVMGESGGAGNGEDALPNVHRPVQDGLSIKCIVHCIMIIIHYDINNEYVS